MPNPKAVNLKLNGMRTKMLKLKPILLIIIVLAMGCTKNEELTYIKDRGTVTDIDGNSYSTVIIGSNMLDLGTQEWMSENLRVSHYTNGDPVVDATDVLGWEWLELNTGAWSSPNNDSQNENAYGKLYNWFAVADSRNICPTGWRVPSDADWTTLVSLLDINTDLVGQSNIAGGLMKEKGTAHWGEPNLAATNKSGFSARGAGVRGGDYHWFGEGAYWWSQTEENEGYAWYRSIQNSNEAIHRAYQPNFKQFGLSIRCLKNADDYIALPLVTKSEVTNISSKILVQI